MSRQPGISEHGIQVRALLDTHALLWWGLDDPQLSPSAREAIAEENLTIISNEVVFDGYGVVRVW